METSTKMVSPAVITSKLADKHLNGIRSTHASVVQGLTDQSVRVANYNAQRLAEKQAQDTQMKQDKIASDKVMMDAQTKQMEAENKRRELDIKQQALSMP